jgi:hypothetical protein
MKQSPNAKRHHRGRGGGRRHGHGFSSNFESSGPDVKIKGSASHVFERYQALARDALAAGDRVAAENYLQHAEHYQRIINAQLMAASQQQPDPNGQPRQSNGRGGDDDADRGADVAGGNGDGEAGRPRGRGRMRARGQSEPGGGAADGDSDSSEPFAL